MLPPGTRLGPYEIIERIGAGGMGEVHKARDTRLDRIVAIKKSLTPFDDRFEREARAIASLNHPCICSLFDVGPDYLVMEYVDGEPLSGPMSVDKALALARQILDALEAAHRKGIVHRDLKPANILVTSGGGVKLLDFGLAKASADLAAGLTTMADPLTHAGTIVGTINYMSPEQLEAKPVDSRSDIFAFGLVLYELLTGRRAFDGANTSSVIAAILKDQPPSIRQLRPATPNSVDRLVQTCLEKDPDKRWQSAREIKHALEWLTADDARHDEPTRAAGAAHRIRWWQTATVVALLAAAGTAIWARRPAPAQTAEAMRFQVLPPPDSTFSTYVGLSPDGQHLAFTATGGDEIGRVWVRDLKSLEARVLTGTEGAQSIIWSPDSRHIAFGFSNQLKRIDIAGGPPQLVCEADSPVGSGAWSADGIIIFGSRGGAGGIKRVAATGGVPTPLTARDAGTSSFPSLLSGRRFIYYWRGPIEGIFVGSMDEPPERQPTTPLLPSAYAAAYVRGASSSDGYLFFVRDQTLMVQRFDELALRLSGDAVPIDRIATVNAYSAFSVSTNGRLAYRSDARSTSRQLTWFDRDGKRLGTIGEPAAHEQLALSPDGRRAAHRDDIGSVAGNLWLTDLTRGVSEKLTVDRSLGGFPVWSPDGTHIAYRVVNDVVQQRTSGVGSPEILLRSPIQTTPTGWSPDGRFLLLTSIGAANTQFDIDLLSMTGERRVAPFLQTQYSESQATFSPDGHWVAVHLERIRAQRGVHPLLLAFRFVCRSAREGLAGRRQLADVAGRRRRADLPLGVRRPDGCGHHAHLFLGRSGQPKAAVRHAGRSVGDDPGRQALPRVDALTRATTDVNHDRLELGSRAQENELTQLWRHAKFGPWVPDTAWCSSAFR